MFFVFFTCMFWTFVLFLAFLFCFLTVKKSEKFSHCLRPPPLITAAENLSFFVNFQHFCDFFTSVSLFFHKKHKKVTVLDMRISKNVHFFCFFFQFLAIFYKRLVKFSKNTTKKQHLLICWFLEKWVFFIVFSVFCVFNLCLSFAILLFEKNYKF